MLDKLTAQPSQHWLVAAAATVFLVLIFQTAAIQSLRSQLLKLRISDDITATNGVSAKSAASAVPTELPTERAPLYSDVNTLASDAGLSLSSYDESQAVDANQAVQRSREISLQAEGTYPNLLAFLVSLQKAYPDIAWVSISLDRKADGAGRGTAASKPDQGVLLSLRLRAYDSTVNTTGRS
jgi:hypothetical protein